MIATHHTHGWGQTQPRPYRRSCVAPLVTTYVSVGLPVVVGDTDETRDADAVAVGETAGLRVAVAVGDAVLVVACRHNSR